MSYEVEIKYRVAALEPIRKRLADLGGVPRGTSNHEDVYFRHPGRDFVRTDEAFRIRKIGEENRITYKGPKQAGPTKTREEIEVRFGDGEDARADFAKILDRLGFRVAATIPKTRTTYELLRGGRRIEVALDEAEGLGSFVEVEAISSGPEDLAGAQEAVLEVAEGLGLVEVEPRSYLRMTLERGSGDSAGPT